MSIKVERIFWLITALALGLYGVSIGETRLYEAYLNREFAETLNTPAPAVPHGNSAAAAVHNTKMIEGQPIGRLEIPAINFSAMVAEGVETSTLRRSIGHVPGTSLPGAAGNVALSAHRDTFFRRLGELHRDDLISITTVDGKFDYVVESMSIVDPDERIVLRDVGRPTLTLLTCYPFYFVGSAPKRFVVHAGRREEH
jgi:sortase A